MEGAGSRRARLPQVLEIVVQGTNELGKIIRSCWYIKQPEITIDGPSTFEVEHTWHKVTL